MRFEWSVALALVIAFVVTVAVGVPVYEKVTEIRDQQLQCEEYGGDYCLSSLELECKDLCGEPYFYSRSSGFFGADSIVCKCKGEE